MLIRTLDQSCAPTQPLFLAGQTDDGDNHLPDLAIPHAEGLTPSFLRRRFLGSTQIKTHYHVLAM